MRWSTAFIPTLRDDPADAEAASHRLLVRAGYVRRLAAGSYSMLPLGERVRERVLAVIVEEMDAIGAQRVHLPALHPAEPWQRTGRWEAMGPEMLRLRDRRDADLCLAVTHEEVVAVLAAEVRSYRQLPQAWYQVQAKFRDEPRPRGGLIRVREFTMKDSYSLDADTAGLDEAFERHRGAYRRIFGRCGLEAVEVEASTGAMGGSDSVEVMVRTEAGEDRVLSCAGCGYAANVERATSRLEPVADPEPPTGVTAPEPFDTPGVRTIAELAAFTSGAEPSRQIKTLVYMVDDAPHLLLLRGDHELVEQKLADAAGAGLVRPAAPAEVEDLLAASVGSLGPVGTHLPVLADPALRGRREMVTGANRDDVHLRHVDVARDVRVDRWVELRAAGPGEACAGCDAPLEAWHGVEVGHLFKLGTRYSEALGAVVQRDDGSPAPIVMGSYGIGVERLVATIAEVHHDERGLVWPPAVAPFHVVVTAVRPDDADVAAAADRLDAELRASGLDVLLDDRDERPGVKFADAELVGVPWRVTVGPRGVASGTAEVLERATMRTEEVPLAEVASVLGGRLGSAIRTEGA